MGKAARFFTGLVVLLLVSITAKNTYGDTFDISWTGGYGPGTAVLTATNDGGGVFTVTAMTGTQNGVPTSLLAQMAYAGNNNFIYPSLPQVLDFLGLGFSAGSTDYNLFFDTTGYAECSSAVTPCLMDVSLNVPVTSVTLTEVPASGVPEPSSLILLSAGLLAAIGASWRRRLSAGSVA